MRILAFSDVPPYVIGGAEMQTWRLATSWVSMGHSVVIAGHRIPEKSEAGVRLIRLPVFYRGGKLLRGATYFFSLSCYLIKNRNNYDLLYCRFLGEAAVSIALLKSMKLIKLPLVAVPAAAGDEDKADVAFLRSLPASRAIVGTLNRQCDCINFIAPGIRESLAAIGVQPCRTASIPNGVPIPVLRASGPVSRVKKILFVGRLVYQKGLDTLLTVLARLMNTGSDFELKLIGDGPERSRLEHLAEKMGLKQRVHFLGKQPQSIVQKELIDAHLFVLPSRYEGLSNAVLEALSFGLPCLVTRCNGIDRYLSNDNGWVCDQGSADQIHLALSEALSLTIERWKAMSDSNRLLMASTFAIDMVAQQNMQLFEEVIERSGLGVL